MKLVSLFLIILMQFVFFPVRQVNAAQSRVDLGTADDFAVLAGSGITISNTSTVTGDIGTYATPTENGLEKLTLSGINHIDDSVTQGAKTDLTTAYNDAAGRGPTINIVGLTVGGGETLTPGVYNSASTILLNGTLTLDGGGDANAVFIFQAGSALTTVSSSKVVLTGSAQACNVYWQVYSAATLGTGTTFVGTIMASQEAITDNGGSTITGRLLASVAAVTLNYTTISKPTCAAGTTGGPALPTPTPTPTATPTTASAVSLALSSAGNSSVYCEDLNEQVVPPSIIESRRVDADSILISWAPYSGVNTFNVQYGTENGKWLHNTDVTGFSTTINNLPANLPIWVRIAARNNCMLGNYGQSKLVGGPNLPDAGFAPSGYFSVTNMLALNMTPLNFLYYSLAIGFLILVGFLSYAAFTLSQTLKRLTSVLVKIDDMAKDADDIKNLIKSGVLGLLSMFTKKGGEKND